MGYKNGVLQAPYGTDGNKPMERSHKPNLSDIIRHVTLLYQRKILMTESKLNLGPLESIFLRILRVYPSDLFDERTPQSYTIWPKYGPYYMDENYDLTSVLFYFIREQSGFDSVQVQFHQRTRPRTDKFVHMGPKLSYLYCISFLLENQEPNQSISENKRMLLL